MTAPSTPDLPHHRHLLLLGALVLLILICPLENYSPLSGLAVRGFTTFVLLSAVYAVSDTHRKLIFAVVLVVPALIIGWYGAISGLPFAISLEYFFNLLFFGYTTLLILYAVVSSREVSQETVSGAISVYLLMGFTWASAYMLIDKIQPGSFLGDAALSFSDYIYFSFVTLTTTGFGDIVPIHEFARSITALETVAGVLYIAVLVARLVAVLGRSQMEKKE